jgi:hypothetical protein
MQEESMISRKNLSVVTLAWPCLAALGLSGCPSTDKDEVTGSEVAVSAVSGAMNNTESEAAFGFDVAPRQQRGLGERIWDQITPIRPAFAASWTCTGATLVPPYWGNGKTASAIWSSTFLLTYDASCDARSPFMDNQATNCSLTRTTPAAGNTRP